MRTVTLYRFVTTHREELIRRCRAKSAGRSDTRPAEAAADRGPPLFLDQLIEELLHGPSKTHEISRSAVQYGHDLWSAGFAVGQVVHAYGDVCQSITELAVESLVPISADDFRTLNGCLDDAIASAVTPYARHRVVIRDGQSRELRSLLTAALVGSEMLQSDSHGAGDGTGAVVHRALLDICTLIDGLPSRYAAPTPTLSRLAQVVSRA